MIDLKKKKNLTISYFWLGSLSRNTVNKKIHNKKQRNKVRSLKKFRVKIFLVRYNKK